MLNALDDYPIHQTAQGVAHTSSGDPNHYDRYFFNGYRRDGSLFFAAAMGLYPNRRVIDAAFSVVRDGVQTSVFASGLAPTERTHTAVGPIRLEVVEPLRVLRLHVDASDHGIRAELTYRARTVALEEAPFRMASGTRLVFDYTRLTQWGTWSGWVELDGVRLPVDPLDTVGSRDRSWGVRPVGERPTAGPPGPVPQFFWLWAPCNFDDVCAHFDVNEYADGRRWHQSGFLVPVIDDDDPVLDEGGQSGSAEPMHQVDFRLEWRPGTRRAAWCEIDLRPWRAEPITLRLEPMYEFQMLGIGYTHPEWGHGCWRGETATGGQRWVLADLDPMALPHLHVQALCRANLGERTGIGILEQLVIGPHEPSGLTGLLDPAR